MLSTFAAVAGPNLFDAHVRSQIIDMPVRPRGSVQMVIHAGTDASGTERTPNINVEPVLESHDAKSPDADSAIFHRREK